MQVSAKSHGPRPAQVGRFIQDLPCSTFNQVHRITGLRPNPNLRRPYYVDNSQSSTYHAWQNSFRKRFSHGLSFDANYTWSKALANGGGDTGAYYDGENGVRNQQFFDLRADRGPAASDITHYFSGPWVYQLPSLAAKVDYYGTRSGHGRQPVWSGPF